MLHLLSRCNIITMLSFWHDVVVILKLWYNWHENFEPFWESFQTCWKVRLHTFISNITIMMFWNNEAMSSLWPSRNLLDPSLRRWDCVIITLWRSWYALTSLLCYDVCRWHGALWAPGHQQPPYWLDCYYDVTQLYYVTCILHDSISTLRPRQNGRHFPDNIFKCIFLNENI